MCTLVRPSPARLDGLRKGMQESADKIRKLEREYQWIASEKQFFGRAGTDYDFEGNDVDKASMRSSMHAHSMGRKQHGQKAAWQQAASQLEAACPLPAHSKRRCTLITTGPKLLRAPCRRSSRSMRAPTPPSRACPRRCARPLLSQHTRRLAAAAVQSAPACICANFLPLPPFGLPCPAPVWPVQLATPPLAHPPSFTPAAGEQEGDADV